MKKREFKSSSKRVLDLMINSIYTNKEIFLREIISNASDALDKISYLSLTNKDLDASNPKIFIERDEKERKLIIRDNGIGMDEEELENNLGTIAESGSLKFKESQEKDSEIIGQFGVGFYSAFMVSKKVEVLTRKAGSEDAYLWTSEGVDGYTLEKTRKDSNGTDIILYLKDDAEDEDYSTFLDEYTIRRIVKKYSDYIRYPINMEVTNSRLKEGSDKEYEDYTEEVTLNSMIPLWKKDKKNITEEEYNNFYTSKFMDMENPLHVIHNNVEGLVEYKSLLFIPSHAPFDYYYKEYKKGLELYTNGVLIMDKCEELLPDYYSFVKGVVDSDDLSLNISRETLQNDRKVLAIAKSLETKIHNELLNMLKEDPDKYKKFFDVFGTQIKYGVYDMYGTNKDKLKDLLMFYSGNKKELITLDEYVADMPKSQKEIYYACGESYEKIDVLPQIEQVRNKKYDVLYLVGNVDEFALQVLEKYDDKPFKNVSDNSLDLETREEKENTKKANEESKDMLDFMKESLSGEVVDVRLTNKISSHPVFLSTQGVISTQMEKVFNAMPIDNNQKAELVLEINENHPIVNKLKDLFENNKDELKNYSKILYSEARLIEGLPLDNPTEISNLICDLISK
jgi:molecular chaperone HtpG